MEDFKAAYSQANLLYGLDITPEDFEEIGLIAWNKIGNKVSRLYRYRAKIDPITLSVDLPCNCDQIEAVTYDFEDWKYTSNDTVNGDYQSQFIENYIESRKLFENQYYINGKYAKYEQVGDTLYFEKDYGMVNILYKGVELDEEGLPYLNQREINAISCYCAYINLYKEGLTTHNNAIIQEAQLLEQQWLRLCDAARIKDHLSQNDMNKILDAKTSWNRKVFNKSYKPVK